MKQNTGWHFVKHQKHLPSPEEELFNNRESISKVLSKIIGTTKRNMK